MLSYLLAILGGLLLLIWSADRFIEGAAITAARLGIPPLVVGMIVVGFGTSVPEMLVSALASLGGNPALALGNAYGSNIVNVTLILGLTALVAPITVQSGLLRRELPILAVISFTSGLLLLGGGLTRWESLLLLVAFLALVSWTLLSSLRSGDDALKAEFEAEVEAHDMALPRALFRLVVGLTFLVVASRLLVWGAVEVALVLGVSELVIGLTIVALGTSLPELAASLVAIRKQEHDIALGNVLGSNMFNLLAVVGIAGAIAPIPDVEVDLVRRDWPVMLAVTLLLVGFCLPRRGVRRIGRLAGGTLLAIYVAYNLVLVRVVLA
ncbi:MAG: calcium/sodium antiporter [Pseudomonadales bacterium]|jgi:cation:H+ antiporter|nr:calcium/sodium antiporter [Pseudomonadales bacterium]